MRAIAVIAAFLALCSAASADVLKVRRDTTANWNKYNPILAQGEQACEMTGMPLRCTAMKIGDGVTKWTALPYFNSGGGGGSSSSMPYPGSGIPYSTGSGWGMSFNPLNPIPANHVALPPQPTTIGPLQPGYHLSGYNSTTGQFSYSADSSVAGGTDPNAVHTTSAGEIAGVAAKSTPAGADLMLIEDSAAGNVKKRARIDSLPYQPPGSYLTTSAIGTTVQGHTAALDSVSGTNSGDETTGSIKSKLGPAGPGDGYMTAAQYATLGTALQPNSNLDATKITGTASVNTTGNAATATKLQTPRTINGVSFDGTGNITVNAVDSTPRAAVGQTMYIGTTAQTINRTSGAETLSGVSIDGNAGTATALASTPSTCGTGQAATGILANGNATGCFTPAGGGGSTTLSGSSAFPATGDTTAITPGYFNTALAAGITTPSVTSSAADGQHMVFCANSGDMTTTGWGMADAGKFCFNQATGKYRYWNGSALTDMVGTGGGSGTVTSITASSPLTGGTITGSGTIGISQASGSQSGYLSSTDWNTFNGKQAALVSGTNIKTVAGISLLGSGDIGTIPTSKGGTGATDFSFSGTAHQVASVTGTKTAGKQLTLDASGNVVASSYDVGAAGGGGGSGTVSNSSNAYRLAGYPASGNTVSDTGIEYATDGSYIKTAKIADSADAQLFRAAPDLTGAGIMGPATSTTTPYYLQLPATPPTNGQVAIFGTPASGTVNGVTANIVPVTYGTNGSGSSMVYPGAGVPVSTGSAWGTSLNITAISDSTSTTSSTTAASSTAVKAAYDLAASKGAGTVTAISVSTTNGVSGTSSGGATPSLTFTLGAITPSSVVATGLVDGLTAADVITTSTYTLNSGFDRKTHYTFNNHATASQAITYTLPAAASGRTECVRNFTGRTGALRVNTSAAGQYIDLDGTSSASGGYVISGGALGDAACFVGVDTTHWVMYAGKGTWTLN